jgi:peptide/nickel transport system substrate-binding protein
MREAGVRVRAKSRSFAPLRMTIVLLVAGACVLPLLSCSQAADPHTLVMIIESSPTDLDPRVGLDAQSERIDELVFDALLTRDEHLNVQPGLAEGWEVPDPLTYVFHLHRGVTFHDGRSLTSRDVKWTFDSLLQGKIRSTKAATYRFVDRIDAPDEFIVVFHLKEPYASLLWNLSEGAIGIVPYGALGEMTRKPIGSGPFKFVSAEPDKEVILERNDNYWGAKARLSRVRFAVVPDATTRALELRKGSADVAINALTPDTLVALEAEPNLRIERGPGTILAYIGFNLRDPVLGDVRVRQAIACAIDRGPLLQYIWRGFAQPASSILPIQSWAYAPGANAFTYNPEIARQILDAAGYRLRNGVRFHLTMKTSTEESTRLLAAVLQQQLRDVGIALDIRTFEFATFMADVTSGAFQFYSLRWIGNEDPDIFDTVFHTHNFPPAGRNRGFYSNPRVDSLIDQARRETDQNVRKRLYAEVQEILAQDVPSINLWYLDNVLVHARRLRNVSLNPSGNYDFLKTAEISAQ